MKNARVISRTAALFASHVAAAFAAAALVSAQANSGRRVVLLSAMLVAGAIATVFAGGALVLRYRPETVPGRRARVVFSTIAAAVVIALCLIYLGSYVGNRVWGGPINYQIVLQYAELAAPNRSPFFIPLTVHLSIVVAVIVLTALYWWSWRFVMPTVVVASRTTALPRLFVVLALGWTCSAGWLIWTLARADLVTREPLIGFFVRSDELFNFSQYSRALQITEEAARARADYPRGQDFQKKHIVVIMVDSLRADRVGVYGYQRPTTPFLDELRESRRLNVVQMALSTCSESNCGILSTLTSKSVRDIAADNFSLPELLQNQGYDVYQLLSGDHEWQGLRQAYGNRQTLYFDSSKSKKYGVNDDQVVFEGLEQVPDYSGKPAFFHFHLMSVHYSGVKHEQYQRYRPSAVTHGLKSLFFKRDIPALSNSYDNGVLEADANIRALFAALDRKGYLSDSVVFILSDHGESLADHGADHFGHVYSLYQEFIRIPLLIYDEPGKRYGNLTFATQVDVAPTVVDRLGLKIPASWQGRSLLSAEIKRYSYHQTTVRAGCDGVVERTDAKMLKYIQCWRSGGGSVEELYDIATDPLERSNLISVADPAVVRRLRHQLQQYLLGADLE
jgi:glucan phosphoethanolaminetransferase (alkaline phosphatase superfamily)